MKKFILIGLSLLLGSYMIYAQEADSTSTKEASAKKNIIRWNLTPLVINTTNLTFGYERVLKNNQSFSVNAGLLLFPQFLNNDSLKVSNVKHGGRLGFTVSADYRFYLTKRNSRPAPEGIYIGPYLSYYQYAFDSEVRLVDNNEIKNDIALDAKFSMMSLGFELGYQFVFWEKLSLDLILAGPSLSYYSGDIKLKGDLDIDQDSDTYKYIQDEILDKYPWMESFLDAKAINTGGNFGKLSMGFRYVIQVGYHF